MTNLRPSLSAMVPQHGADIIIPEPIKSDRRQINLGHNFYLKTQLW